MQMDVSICFSVQLEHLMALCSQLDYTILYNSTRALRIEQLVFGSPNKPDGRSGGWDGGCVAMCTLCFKFHLLYYAHRHIHCNLLSNLFMCFT